MKRSFSVVLAAVCVTGICLHTFADGSATTNPATQGAATQSSADAALSNILGGSTTAPAVPVPALPTAPEVIPATAGVAPSPPAVNRLREGQPVWNRIGRMAKDDAGTGYIFVFESDGKTMQDPPMPLIPCRMLEQMETASEKGTKPVKFKVSGQVTEYHGKNYLLVNFMQATKDMGRGLD